MTRLASQSEQYDWWRNFALFAFSVLFPSLAIFKKVGWLPLAGYSICTVVGLYVLLRHILPFIAPRLTVRNCTLMVVITFALLTIALFYIYPQILKNNGFRLCGIQFGASDSNDAYVATWKAMFAGRYPYYEKSFLGGPISPMPGALFLALPFYVLGCTILQNVVWLVVFWIVLGKYLRDFRLASVVVLTVIGFCPNLIYTILQAGDYMTNSIYVLIPALLLIDCVRSQRSPKWAIGAAALFGLGLSSRANYFLVVPILFFALLRIRGFWSAVKHLTVAFGVFALVTLPFFLYDPAHFSPLHTTGKLDLGGRFPHAAECVFLAGCLLAAILGFLQRESCSLENICARMFFVQEFVLLCGFALASIASGRAELNYAHFTLLAMFFGVFAFGPKLFRDALLTPVQGGSGKVRIQQARAGTLR